MTSHGKRPSLTNMFRWYLVSIAWLAATCTSLSAIGDDQAKIEFYQQRIKPLLEKSCFECHSHSSGEASGQLMLDSLVAVTAGGTRGAAIKPGKPDQSLLLKAVTYADTDLQMPPDGKLPDAAIADLRQWINDGAVGLPMGDSMSASGIKRLTPAESSTHWAYVRPVRQQLPTDQELAALCNEHQLSTAIAEAFIQNRLDALLLKAQLSAGLVPSPPADRATLARRLAYDLTGLPPDPEWARRFYEDDRPTEIAFRDLVDRFLSSVHFGERFARHWMDVARYADTKGYVFREEREYAGAFKYRDWLIAAFNSDLPYKEFVRDQLAADKADPNNDQGDLPALGFLTLGRRFLNNKNDIIDDRLDVTTRGLMGLTVACARCHDHKYDPVSQADYYSLVGVFLNTDEPGGDPWPHRLIDSKEERQSHILIRGSPGNRGDQVPRKFISFLSTEDKPFASGSGRDELADRIVAPENPLTARVMVNRLWMRLMGSSIVDSPSDFGARCPPPRLQPVLDELAVEFVDSGWSTKSLIRLIATSSAYQQRSVAEPTRAALDPENALYWRANRRRLDFESLRDTTLLVTGQLDATVGGASEKIHERPYSHRRTVYAFIDRQNLPGIFRNFDVASPDSHSPQRLQTTVPQQGLYLLNSGFVSELAHAAADQVQKQSSLDDRAKVHQLFERILRREPSAAESQAAIELLQSVSASAEPFARRWIYGYGEVDPEANVLKTFNELPYTNGALWQGGSKMPDSKLGWCLLHKDGGHPGHDLQHAVVRRWIAPHDGKVAVRGKLHHRSDMGNGVRGALISSRKGGLGSWQSKQQEVRTVATDIEVQAGDSLDLVTDSLGDEAYDGFEWKVRIQYVAGGETFDSSRELPSIPSPPMNPWDQLAQALLATNEFAFVD